MIVRPLVHRYKYDLIKYRDDVTEPVLRASTYRVDQYHM